MKKVVLIGIVSVLILLLTTPVSLAVEHLTSEDFKETLPTMNPKKDYYREGEKVEIEYLIEPASEGDAKKLDERYYSFMSELDGSEIKAIVTLVSGAAINHPKPGDVVEDGLLEIKIEDTVDGIYQIKVSVSGTIPEIDGRYEEVKALYFDITDADDDALPPVVLKVYDLNEFNEDIQALKDEINKLSSVVASLEDEGYDVTDVSSLLSKAQTNLTLAEEYLKSDDYKNSDSKLDAVETQIEEINTSINQMKADAIYNSLKSTLEDISSTLEDIDLYLGQVASKVNIETYTTLKADYNDLQDEYNDLNTKIGNIKSNYLDQGKYATAYSKLKEYEDDVINLNNQTASLLENVKAVLFGKPSEGGFDILGILKEYALYIGVAVLGIAVVAVAIMAFRRRGGRWDELR